MVHCHVLLDWIPQAKHAHTRGVDERAQSITRVHLPEKTGTLLGSIDRVPLQQ